MITLAKALEIHRLAIEEFGGSDGLRDAGTLLSALERPSSGFGDIEFYPSAAEKAAALLESIVKNHPFVDGNKRTGYTLARLMLLKSDFDLVATTDERYDFVVKVASGEMEYEAILAWIQEHLIGL
jgi:death-on-curing protein